MFFRFSAFNQDISNWDVSSATNMGEMFNGNTSFNQPIGNWDVASVTDMSAMFAGATSFDQDLSTWDVSNVTTMLFMLSGVTLSTANYDALLIAWDNLNVQPSVIFDVGNSKYCNEAVVARTNLIANDNWVINDGGPAVCAAPTVQTGAASSITATTASITATVISDGGGLDDVGVEYGPTNAYGQSHGNGSGVVGDNTVSLTGLTCNTTYHYRVYATNNIGTANGTDATFTTAICQTAPTVITGGYVIDGSNGVTVAVDSTVTNNGGDNNIQVGIQYGLTPSYGSQTVGSYNGVGNVSNSSITNLICSTTYHYRSYATNNNGTGYGADATFIVPCADISLFGRRISPTPILAGDSLFYEYTVRNNGPGNYADMTGYVIAIFNIPSNTTYVSASTNNNYQLQCQDMGPAINFNNPADLSSYDGNIVECSAAPIDLNISSGEQFKITLNLTADSDFTIGQETLRAGVIAPSTQEKDLLTLVQALNSSTPLFSIPINNIYNLTYGMNDTNSDQDSIPDVVEQASPNNGDGNNDGIPDSEQSNVTSLPTTDGTYVTLALPEGTTISSTTVDALSTLSTKDIAFNYPLGLVSFTATTTQGATVPIQLFFYTNQQANTFTPRKYNPTTQTYSTIPNTTLTDITIANRHVVKLAYSITDGGILDQDNTANGTIIDPVGLAQATVGVPNTGL